MRYLSEVHLALRPQPSEGTALANSLCYAVMIIMAGAEHPPRISVHTLTSHCGLVILYEQRFQMLLEIVPNSSINLMFLTKMNHPGPTRCDH